MPKKFTVTLHAEAVRKLRAAAAAAALWRDVMPEQHEQLHSALIGRPDTAPRDPPAHDGILNSRRPGAFQDDSLDAPVALPARSRRTERRNTVREPRVDWPIPMPAPTPSATEMNRLREENDRLRQQLVRAALTAPAPVYLLPMRGASDLLLIDDVTTATQRHPSPVAAEDAKPLPSRKIVTD